MLLSGSRLNSRTLRPGLVRARASTLVHISVPSRFLASAPPSLRLVLSLYACACAGVAHVVKAHPGPARSLPLGPSTSPCFGFLPFPRLPSPDSVARAPARLRFSPFTPARASAVCAQGAWGGPTVRLSSSWPGASRAAPPTTPWRGPPAAPQRSSTPCALSASACAPRRTTRPGLPRTWTRCGPRPSRPIRHAPSAAQGRMRGGYACPATSLESATSPSPR